MSKCVEHVKDCGFKFKKRCRSDECFADAEPFRSKAADDACGCIFLTLIVAYALWKCYHFNKILKDPATASSVIPPFARVTHLFYQLSVVGSFVVSLYMLALLSHPLGFPVYIVGYAMMFIPMVIDGFCNTKAFKNCTYWKVWYVLFFMYLILTLILQFGGAWESCSCADFKKDREYAGKYGCRLMNDEEFAYYVTARPNNRSNYVTSMCNWRYLHFNWTYIGPGIVAFLIAMCISLCLPVLCPFIYAAILNKRAGGEDGAVGTFKKMNTTWIIQLDTYQDFVDAYGGYPFGVRIGLALFSAGAWLWVLIDSWFLGSGWFKYITWLGNWVGLIQVLYFWSALMCGYMVKKSGVEPTCKVGPTSKQTEEQRDSGNTASA